MGEVVLVLADISMVSCELVNSYFMCAKVLFRWRTTFRGRRENHRGFIHACICFNFVINKRIVVSSNIYIRMYAVFVHAVYSRHGCTELQ